MDKVNMILNKSILELTPAESLVVLEHKCKHYKANYARSLNDHVRRNGELNDYDIKALYHRLIHTEKKDDANSIIDTYYGNMVSEGRVLLKLEGYKKQENVEIHLYSNV